jgi:hypothetical protein
VPFHFSIVAPVPTAHTWAESTALTPENSTALSGIAAVVMVEPPPVMCATKGRLGSLAGSSFWTKPTAHPVFASSMSTEFNAVNTATS